MDPSEDWTARNPATRAYERTATPHHRPADVAEADEEHALGRRHFQLLLPRGLARGLGEGHGPSGGERAAEGGEQAAEHGGVHEGKTRVPVRVLCVVVAVWT